jgi:hypothetical protein
MTNFGFQPGILDYWMLLTDWRNGSFAILLALGVLLVGYGQAQNLTRWWPVSRVSTLAWRVVSSLWRK